MKSFHLIICIALVTMLIWLNRMLVPDEAATIGGLSWYGWLSVGLVIFFVGFVSVANDAARTIGFFRTGRARIAELPSVRVLEPAELAELGISRYRGPEYPHPVIFVDRCIGCQACVDACPHDVLAIIDGHAVSVAPELCMEDTACQAECPVNPKACIVINTTKPVVSRPSPTRDGSTYQTNVPGCYIIGDVSGVPLIKNAVKEGAEVIAQIARDLKAAEAEPKAEYDVAIIGIGPGGASAAISAKKLGLRYAAIEQDQTLASIENYPKGKYIYFKPDTKEWAGGLPILGLGLSKSKYETDNQDDDLSALIGPQLNAALEAYKKLLCDELIAKIPRSLQTELSPVLADKVERELCSQVFGFLRRKGSGDWADLFQTYFVPEKEDILSSIRTSILARLQAQVPGDQRENILAVWLQSLSEHDININEFESCKAVLRAEEGDYFVVKTERAADKSQHVYNARRVVLAIGLRGAPNKLRLPNEDMMIRVEGRDEPKVLYSLSNPADFRGRRIVVVGGGNVAVEAAVDLVANRNGSEIIPRPADEMNQVILLVRDSLAPTVKFGNKVQLYQCSDDGILDLRFGIAIKEMRWNELVFEDVNTGREIGTVPNDYVFALIGGERPDRFLKSIGITIE